MAFDLKKEYSYALIGASNNPEKYGYKIFHDLLNKRYRIIPINSHESEIQGKTCYHDISKVKEKIDVIIFVVPPEITEKILINVKELEINKVWFQPGSESENAINFCKNNSIKIIYNQCIMLR